LIFVADKNDKSTLNNGPGNCGVRSGTWPLVLATTSPSYDLIAVGKQVKMSSSSSRCGTGEFAKRIQSITGELVALHGELYWMALDASAAPRQEQLNDLDIHLVTDFKSALDNMRDLLWKYLEAAAKVEPQRIQEAAEAHRVRRVTRLLDLLRERLGQYADGQPTSFIEQISASINEKYPNTDKAA
jgi:hypothetical protein